MDATFHFIRERVWNFPRTYEDKFTIEDSIMPQLFDGCYEKFKPKRKKGNFKFKDHFYQYVNRDRNKFKRYWKEVNFMFYALCLSANHWILCHIWFSSWDITMYDSDQTLNNM